MLRLNWNHYDRLGHASLLDLTLIACDGTHYRALPFELEQRCDEEVQILIPSTALGSLRPVGIVEAFQMSAWDAAVEDETLHLCGMIPLPGATR